MSVKFIVVLMIYVKVQRSIIKQKELFDESFKQDYVNSIFDIFYYLHIF
jgi:hypothetical protein